VASPPSEYGALDAIRKRALVDVADGAGVTRSLYTAYERVGVAGYKSTIHALDALFEMRWLRDEYRYDAVPRSSEPRQLVMLALIERLLLGRRRWRGVSSHTHARSFPAHDGPLLLGALSPVETAMLAQRLSAWEVAAAQSPATSGPMSDRIFERIRAAAGAKTALVAMHSML
jgi:hypothetical protein